KTKMSSFSTTLRCLLTSTQLKTCGGFLPARSMLMVNNMTHWMSSKAPLNENGKKFPLAPLKISLQVCPVAALASFKLMEALRSI
ncbi:unnamed protein product, partial [Aphanomyces euteiches]